MVSFQQLNQQSTSNIQHRTSNVEHPTSNIQHRTSNVEHPTSNIQHRTSNVEHPTSNVQQSNNPASCSRQPRCGAGVIVQQSIQLLPGLHAVEPGPLRAPPLPINQTTSGCLHRDPAAGPG